MNEEQIRELLSEMRDEPVPSAGLARVRLAVTERVRSRRRAAAWRGRAAAGLAAAGLTLAVLRPWAVQPVAVTTPPATVREPEVTKAREPGLVKAVPEEPKAPARHTVRKPVQPVRAVRQQPADVESSGAREIRIENDADPDVVIVLIGG